jgi:hypothetical protein
MDERLSEAETLFVDNLSMFPDRSFRCRDAMSATSKSYAFRVEEPGFF